MAFYMTVEGRSRLVPDRRLQRYFEANVPEFARLYQRAGSAYLWLVARLARAWRQRGWTVRSIPLSGLDAQVARAALAGTGAELLPFHADPAVALRRIAGCERVVASRLHAHVFALRTGTPVHSIASAHKCQALWSDLGLPAAAQVERVAVAGEPQAALDRLLDPSLAATLAPGEGERLAQQALDDARATLLAVAGI